MAFQLINVDDYKTRVNQLDPTIGFSKTGSISLNTEAAKMMDIKKECFLSILIDEKKLAIKITDSITNSIKLRVEGPNDKNLRYTAQCTGLIHHLTKVLDWPLGDDKLPRIKYKLVKSEDNLYLLV